MSTTLSKIIVFGAGYVGGELAESLVRKNLPTKAICSSQRSESVLRAQQPQLEIHSLNLDHPNAGWVEDIFTQSTESYCIVYLVPPNQVHGHDVRLRTLLDSLPSEPKQFVYISTTGVYGDCKGNVVTEGSPLAPASNRAKLRVDAERQVVEYCSRRSTAPTILRVAGIYGPGRLPIEAIRSKRAMINQDEANPGNRIHRDDLVDIIAACLGLACGTTGGSGNSTTTDNTTDSIQSYVYNVCDGNHMTSTQFTGIVAQLMGLPAPPQISRQEMQSTASPRRWSFLAESRIIDTTKLQQFLATPLRFGDPLDGIRHSLKYSREAASSISQ